MRVRSPKARSENRDWRAFEVLIATIEERLAPKGAIVKSPDRLKDLDGGRSRQVDASIRTKVGSVDLLITVECRKRKDKSDVTWIEQIATKREKLGAAKTIAVSARGFSKTARQTAGRYGIELRVLDEITSADIDQWFAPESYLHLFRSIKIVCTVEMMSGEVHEVDSMAARFRHPEVHGVFPAAVFPSFIEMKDPKAFREVPLSEMRQDLTFVLDGQASDLIPVPLGEVRKEGCLELLVADSFEPVRQIRLEMAVRYTAKQLEADEGHHYLYGPPDSPALKFSQFDSEMFGLPVRIEQFVKSNTQPEATISFPSGVKLPGKLLNPRITDISRVKSDQIHNVPVRVALHNGATADGMFFNLLPDFFDNDKEYRAFNNEYLLFLFKEDRERLRVEAMKETLTHKAFLDAVKVLPRTAIAWIDITPAIKLAR